MTSASLFPHRQADEGFPRNAQFGESDAAEAGSGGQDVLSSFNLEQFSERAGTGFAGVGGWQTVGGGGARGGAVHKHRRRNNLAKRLRQLLGSGHVMSEEQVDSLNPATLKTLKPDLRQQFYRWLNELN